MSDQRVIIVGGGVSGLSTAYYLGKQGIPSILFEKSDRLGGLLRTDHIAGCDLEAGPDSFIASKPAVLELAADLGLADQVLDSNDAGRKIFIGRKSHLVPMPQGMVMMAPSDLGVAFRSSFFGLRTKLRFAQELRAKPRERSDDVTLGNFVLDHFGKEVLDSIAEPLLTGVYGGDPSGLSLQSVLPRFLDYERKYGSVIRGVQHERRERKGGASLFRSFRDGMQTLTDALASVICSTTEIVHGEVQSVRQKRSAGWEVCHDGGVHESDNLILAVPAHTGSRLLAATSRSLSRLLGEIPYSSAILVTTVFDRATLAHPLDGFGFLIPRTERRTTAAATWISTKFPVRTPDSLAAIRSFIVGNEAVRLMSASDADVISVAKADLAHWMNLKNEPKVSVISRWPNSMPQYVVGHAKRMAEIQSQTAALPGLHLAGNAYDGVGIPDCVRLAKAIAEQISVPVAVPK